MVLLRIPLPNTVGDKHINKGIAGFSSVKVEVWESHYEG